MEQRLEYPAARSMHDRASRWWAAVTRRRSPRAALVVDARQADAVEPSSASIRVLVEGQRFQQI